MLSDSELEHAKDLYGILYLYGQLSVREIRELDDLASRASEEQLKKITFQDDPEGARAWREAAERQD